MPDRYDDELKKLRSVEVPDQWDDIIGRAGGGPDGGRTEVKGESRRTRWILLIASTALVILIAGSVAIMRRNDNEVTETTPSASTTGPLVEPDDRVAPSLPETLPTPQYSSCTALVAAPEDGSGFAFVPGPASPPLLSTDAMAGVNTTWHATVGLQTVEIHFPATAAGDLRGERTESVNTTWGDATVWYAAYGMEDTLQIRVPAGLPACGQWDVTVHGPDETANRDVAIEIASGTQ